MQFFLNKVRRYPPMPPRRRNRNDAASSSPSPAPEPSPRGSSIPSASPSATSSHDDSEPPRFFNTTFTTYRTSPLYIGKQALTPARLQVLSRRLRDALVGDVVRGVQVGLESDSAALGRTGALYAVEWRWVGAERILGPRRSDRREGSVELGNDTNEDDERAGRTRQRVLCIELRYENARFTAMLLPDLAGDDNSLASTHQPSWTWQTDNGGTVDQTAFVHLPLLIFRMPAPLKSVLIDFLSSTFDCRIHPLALGTRTLISSWEAWLSDNGSTNGRRALGKDVFITLGFHLEPPEPKTQGPGENGHGESDVGEQSQKPPEPLHLGLKTVDITIPAVDVHRFLHVGEKLDDQTQTMKTKKRKADAKTTLSEEQQGRRRRKLAGGRDEEGWAWRSPAHDSTTGEQAETIEQPFTEALAAYMWHHLGLDMFHPGVRVQRVACDGFALSEGRLKIFAPGGSARGRGGNVEESAVWRLIGDLVWKARGKPGWGSDMIAKMTVQ
ncbi:kinetochore complex Sim4 subunit Fta1-domain-containing protein [Hypoxylon sp. FL1857]|nr:kinetochore complex Sim4 subunit Fta1-domain-containing protein [Hypoxylon sp. FL1857]